MRLIPTFLMLATIAVTSPVGAADSGSTDTVLRGFYAALSDYYGVPEREVIIVRERKIRDDEIPVILYLSKQANVRSSTVSDLRLNGASWADITRHLGLSPEIFYVPVSREYGPPYGNAYGHFKNKHKSKWSKIHLRDDDVVNLVNLRFISDHYRYSPDKVIELRSAGNNFIVINNKVKHAKKELAEDHKESDSELRGGDKKHSAEKHQAKENKGGKHPDK